jgi:hypothetical protein
MTTVFGKSQGQDSTSGALPLPLESRSTPSLSAIAERLYSMRKERLRLWGGFTSGSPAFLRSRQDLRPAKNAWTQASAVWACSLEEVCQRIRCEGPSQMPLCRTLWKIGDDDLTVQPAALLRKFIQL